MDGANGVTLDGTNGVTFDAASAVWTWTPAVARLVKDTWCEVQVHGDSEWRSRTTYLELNKVKAVSKTPSEVVPVGRAVTLPYWDRGLHEALFGGLEGFVMGGNDATLRLSIYGGQGQSNVAFSEWISAKELVFQATNSRPRVTAEELQLRHEAAAARTAQKVRREEREAAEAEQRKEQRKRAEARRVEREKKLEAQQAREAAERAAFAAQGWRDYHVPQGHARCCPSLGKLASTGSFEGWSWRDATRPTDPTNASVIFLARNGQEIHVSRGFPEAHQELEHLMEALCFALPQHAEVEIDQKAVTFEGGSCFVVSSKPNSGAGTELVKVKAAVGGTYSVPKRAIVGVHECPAALRGAASLGASKPVYGVESLKVYFKRTKKLPFDEWRRGLSPTAAAAIAANAAPTPLPAAAAAAAAAATAVPAAAAAAAGAAEEDAATSMAMLTAAGALPVKAERLSHPASPLLGPGSAGSQAGPPKPSSSSSSSAAAAASSSPPPPHVVKRELQRAPELPVTLLFGQPVQQARANSGTVRNGRVFVGVSQVAPDGAAGKGLFSRGVIGAGEVISKFDGELASVETPCTHRIALESGANGRVLDCSTVTRDFTSAQPGMTIGRYRGTVFYPSSVDSPNYDAGVAAFANSSSERLEMNAKVKRYDAGLMPCKFLVATRRIVPGEEILYNYRLYDAEEPSGQRAAAAAAAAAATRREDLPPDGQRHTALAEGHASPRGAGGKRGREPEGQGEPTSAAEAAAPAAAAAPQVKRPRQQNLPVTRPHRQFRQPAAAAAADADDAADAADDDELLNAAVAAVKVAVRAARRHTARRMDLTAAGVLEDVQQLARTMSTEEKLQLQFSITSVLFL
jgi:hypothetical protein